MASTKLIEYERKRVENIKKYEEMLAASKIKSAVSELSSIFKRQRPKVKSCKEKNQKIVEAAVLRKSSRIRGVQQPASPLRGLTIDSGQQSYNAPCAMESTKLTEYEKKRVENIKKNEEMLAAFKIKSAVSELSSIFKRQRQKVKSSKEKKQKIEAAVLRKSSRIRGVQPPASSVRGLTDNFSGQFYKRKQSLGGKPEPFSIHDAYKGDGSCGELINLITSFSRKSEGGVEKKELASAEVSLGGWDMKAENVASVVPGNVLAVKFFPTTDKTLVVAGDNFGYLGLWNVGAQEEEGCGVYMYHPHSAPVSGIVIEPFSMSNMITSGCDGFIRMMDTEREVFDLVYMGNGKITSLSGRPYDSNSLYFSEGCRFHMLDLRAGKSSVTWNLHESTINTIDFSSSNTNLMATSSSDATACIWDLRNMRWDKWEPLKVINQKQGVQSAYFSPSGTSLAITRMDSRVSVSSVANIEDVSEIYDTNFKHNKLIPRFRGIWGWDDSYIYIANLKRRVDIISTVEKKVVDTLESENMMTIPCRLDSHQYNVGMLAGGTVGGEVYVWTSS